MSETADEQVIAQEETVQPTAEEVWSKTVEEPITTEDVAGTKAETKEEVLPDRALVAPELANFIKTNVPKEPSALEQEIREIKTVLSELRQPATPQDISREEVLIQKLEALEAREAQRLQAEEERAAEEAYEAQVRTLKEGVIENVRAAKDKFPALIALGQEELVFTSLVDRLQKGENVSEDDIASKIEADLKVLRDKLNEAYKTDQPSEDLTPSKAPSKTLTPDLSASDDPFDLDDAIKKNKKAAAQALWERLNITQ